MEKIKCLLPLLTLILLGCNSENEKKTDAPKLEPSIIEKIDSSNYLFLDYYFGMSYEQFEKTSKSLFVSGRIQRTKDTTENIYQYKYYVGKQFLDVIIRPDFVYQKDKRGNSYKLGGIGLICNSTINHKPMSTKEIDKMLYDLYTDKYGKPIELFEEYKIFRNVQNISNAPFFKDFWMLRSSTIKLENDFYEKETYFKGEKYFRWDNSNRIVNISLGYSLEHTKSHYEIYKAYWERTYNKKFNMTKDEFEYRERKFREKAEANKVEIKIYYANAKDLKMREDKQRTEDSTLKANAKKKLNSVINQNKSDI
jgi:hypothetical protein